MGSCLWFYDQNFNSGEGQWCNLEFSNFEGATNGKWIFWDTNDNGFFFANTDLSQHHCGDISDLIDGLNFPGIGGSLGAAKIPVLTVKGLETEPIYPGPIANLFGLGQRGLDLLLDLMGKAQDAIDDTVEDINDFFDELGDAINDFDGTPIESDKEPNLADKMKNALDGIKDGMNLFNDAKDIAKNAPKDEKGNIKAGEVGSSDNPYQNSVSDTTAETILDFDIDLAIKAGTLGTNIQNNVSATPGALGGEGSLGAKGTHNNLPGMGQEDGGYPAPYVNENGDIVIPDTYAFRPGGHEETWLPKATEALIDGVNKLPFVNISNEKKQNAVNQAATVMDQSVGIFMGAPGTVSYTHLTLPTICSV